MFLTFQPRVVGLKTPEEPQEHALFPPVSGTIISTLHHQQLPSIITTWQLTTSSHIAITEFLLDQGLSLADAKSSKEKCQVLYCSML